MERTPLAFPRLRDHLPQRLNRSSDGVDVSGEAIDGGGSILEVEVIGWMVDAVQDRKHQGGKEEEGEFSRVEAKRENAKRVGG